MKESLKISKMLISVIVIIFLFQLVFMQSAELTLSFVEVIHNSPLKDALVTVTQLFSYVILYFLYGTFFLNIMVFSPNVVDNAIYILFICITQSLTACLKLIIGELRPFMISALHKEYHLEVFECQSDFGMPSSDIIQAVMLYYLFKTFLFDKERHIVLSKDIQGEYKDENYFTNYFSLQRCDFIIREYCNVFGLDFSIRLFDILFLSYLGILALCKVVSGGALFCQILFGLLIGFCIGHYFFIYFRMPIRQYVADIIINPSQRQRATKYWNILFQLYISFCIVISIAREYFRNEKENEILMNKVATKCDHFYSIEEQSLKDSFILILPMVMLNCYNYLNLTEKLYDDDQTRQTFSDLILKQKIKRVFLIGGVLGLFFGLKTLLDYVVIWKTEGNYFNFHNIVIYIISNIILGIFLAYILPLTLHATEVLLKFEWIFIEDFQKIKTSKNPNFETHMLVVYKNNESKDDKISEIKGKKISKKRINGALNDLKNMAKTAKYMV